MCLFAHTCVLRNACTCECKCTRADTCTCRQIHLVLSLFMRVYTLSVLLPAYTHALIRMPLHLCGDLRELIHLHVTVSAPVAASLRARSCLPVHVSARAQA